MEETDMQEPLIERLSASPEPTRTPTKKRKRAGASEGPKNTKFAKRRIVDEGNVDVELNIDKLFSQMSNQLISDYIMQRTKKFESDLSFVEFEDRHISANSIQDTTSWVKPRTLDNLPGFLEHFAQNPTKLWAASKKNGAPHTIIVAGAGLRAADLARVIRKFQTKDAVVAKLFAKHIKIEEAMKFLKHNRTGIAVGTPVRLNDLIENGALALDKVQRIVVDASHIDQKRRGILGMKETQIPLVQWLNRKDLKERYAASKNGIDLLFY